MSEIETITTPVGVPVVTDGRPEQGAQPGLCQGWLCNALRDPHGSAPAAGPSARSALGGMGSCPIHSWY